MTNIHDQITAELDGATGASSISAREYAAIRLADIARNLARVVDEQAAQLAANNTAPLVFEVDTKGEASPDILRGILPAGSIMLERGGPVRLLNGTVQREGGPTRADLNALDHEFGEAVRAAKAKFEVDATMSLGSTFDDLYDLVADRLASWVREQRPADLDDHQVEPEPSTDVPKTRYGVRVFYADDTAVDLFNVDGIQLADLEAGTFPFGFIRTTKLDEDDQEVTEHRAGFWDENGQFITFDSRDQPNPNGGW